MQMKHLIIFALVGMAALLGFNLISGHQRDKHREMLVSNNSAEAETVIGTGAKTGENIASQPLGQQPKAILDDATTQIEHAQRAEQQRVAQVANAQ
ncbi:hypothetical protein R0I52_03490 [Psychrobacter sp. CAM01]|uniref:hypothetical protein n=1 Tax=Psychrobacter sp. CAM01 TaxID=3080335 RepID=UPI00293631E9|nr:hypothetical protein [Psychrobacter sp. CAM01]MDV2859770.1 hypothetical protein [Psychrobacter sp. CAM01]